MNAGRKPRRGASRKAISFGLGAALAALGLLVALVVLDSTSRIARQFMRQTVRNSLLFDLRTSDPRPSDRIRLAERADEPSLVANLYQPSGETRAAILFVHGNRSSGADYSLYRLLAKQLSGEGCWVLALSLRGYGQSDPAPEGRPIRAEDLLKDLERGLDYMRAHGPMDAPQAVVGHSLGANLALLLGRREGLRVIAIEPGLRLHERVVEPPAPDLVAFAAKLSRNLRGGVKDIDTVRTLYQQIDPETTGVPVRPDTVLIIQGEGISPKDRLSIERSHARRPNSDLLWLERSHDHQFGVIEIGKRVIFPSALVHRVVRAVSRFAISGEHGEGAG